jgi:hypothetical protein
MDITRILANKNSAGRRGTYCASPEGDYARLCAEVLQGEISKPQRTKLHGPPVVLRRKEGKEGYSPFMSFDLDYNIICITYIIE